MFIMNTIISLLVLSAFATASVIQHPLNDGFGSQAPLSSKPLVSSEALEGHITSKNLLKRAKELFEIAELGAAEYNHPTRVIGSSGKHQPQTVLSVPSANGTVVQDMLEP
jgi:aminopeptidase Y